MRIREWIGAKLALGLPGPSLTPDAVACLRQTQAQSLVVFARNFATTEQFLTLLRDAEAAVGHRLVVMVDHEGGRVIRFSRDVTRFPAALTVGSRQEADAVRQQGAIEAQELKRLGVHVNLAPCVDVIRESADPVIGDRSYGTDPVRVAELGVARIQGLESHGVAACAKHFPGLGAVPLDPHQRLPTIPLTWETLERVDLVPFRAAVTTQVAMIMSSHVCYPALGDPPGLPATFSCRLIHSLLRERLQFDGLVLTDDLEMGALQAYGGIGEAAVRATEAGHDILLICSDLQAGCAAAAALQASYESGRLDEQELAESVQRFSAMRQGVLGEPLAG